MPIVAAIQELIQNPEKILTWYAITLATIHFMGIVAAVDAVMKAKTSQGAIAWAISLLFLPLFSVPLYLLFGGRRFTKYVEVHRVEEEKLRRINRDIHRQVDQPYLSPDGLLSWEKKLESFGVAAFTCYNSGRLLINGPTAFDAMVKAMEAAERYILVEYFTIMDDAVGNRFKDVMVRKAKEGVKVYLVFDQIGCRKLKGKFIEDLEEAGVEHHCFRTNRTMLTRFQLNFRNHRKIVVVDGEVAFTGGLNLGEPYLGTTERYGRWRDTNVEVRGPSVKAIQGVFLNDFYYAGQRVPDLDWSIKAQPEAKENVLVVPTGPTGELEACSLFYQHCINSAKRRLWIVSPYFVPDEPVLGALKLAAIRGVDVRIMLPGKHDHLLVFLSSFSYIREVAPAGVKVYRYKDAVLHQKVMLVDDEVAVVGTVNLDNRSLHINFELSVVFARSPMVKHVEAMLLKDFEQCGEVDYFELDKRGFLFRLSVAVARLLSPVQ